MFLLKKIISPFFSTLPFCILIVGIGFLLSWKLKKSKVPKALFILAVAYLMVVSYGLLASPLLAILEKQNPPLMNIHAFKDAKWIVVLGGGVIDDFSLPVNERLSKPSRIRLLEGISIHKKIPESKLLFSGGLPFGSVPEAKVMAEVAIGLGLDANIIRLEDRSVDTKDQAKYIRDMIGMNRFILVTSATHMPRALAMFRKHGMAPIPAPTDFLSKTGNRITPSMFFPNAERIVSTDRATREIIGILWAKLRGQI